MAEFIFAVVAALTVMAGLILPFETGKPKYFLLFFIGIAMIIGASCCQESNIPTKHENLDELISLRNKYQAEYNLYHETWNLRQFERRGYTDEYSSFVATFDEIQREQLCKDSIEILNIKIDKYKNH